MPRKSLVLFMVVVFAGALGVSRAFSQEPNEKEIQTLRKIIAHVQEDYVTPVDPKKLWEGACRGALEALNDPFTQYFNQPEATRFEAETEGKFGGLGIEISTKDGILTVITPIKGTPAYEGGILAGDQILKIDGKSTERLNLEDAVGTLRGKVGTKVTLTVRHLGEAIDREITLTRAEIKPASVEGAMLDPKSGIGYIEIVQFTETVHDDMMAAVKDLQKQGLKGMIIDLRGNPGGLLDKAVDIADDFLTSGVIVSVRGRQPEMTRTYTAHKGQKLESLPIIVVVDEGSASASEILAAALHDNNRSLLIGGRTFGKGSVQNVIPLGNGESLKMTTAHYYRPNNEPIEFHQGIMPDIYLPMTREHELALRNQEREDKLRGRYRLGADFVGPQPSAEPSPAEPSPAAPANAPAGETKGKEGDETRRGRVVDFQLQAALNILKWQIIHPAAPAMGTDVVKAEK